VRPPWEGHTGTDSLPSSAPSRHCREPTLDSRQPRRPKLRINRRQHHSGHDCESFKFHTWRHSLAVSEIPTMSSYLLLVYLKREL
jgi:hypothetical protein